MNEKTETPETLAALLSEMRHRADNHRQDGWESVGEELDDLADRIESAAAREREETKAYFEKLHDGPSMICTARNCAVRNVGLSLAAPGNTAEMRGALDKAECVLLVAARFATDNAFTDAEARENLRDVDWYGALTEIDAALAAPARNCDILSEEAANKAWDDYRHANVLPRGGWDFRHIIAWLFAPAEGGAE